MNNSSNLTGKEYALTEQEQKSPVWKAMFSASQQSEKLESEGKLKVRPFTFVFPKKVNTAPPKR